MIQIFKDAKLQIKFEKKKKLCELMVDAILDSSVNSAIKNIYKSMTDLDIISQFMRLYSSEALKTRINDSTLPVINNCKAKIKELLARNYITRQEAIIGFAILPDASAEELYFAAKILAKMKYSSETITHLFWNSGTHPRASLCHAILVAKELISFSRHLFQDADNRLIYATDSVTLIQYSLNRWKDQLTHSDTVLATQAIIDIAYNSPDYLSVARYIIKDSSPENIDLVKRIIRLCTSTGHIVLEQLEAASSFLKEVDPSDEVTLNEISSKIRKIKESWAKI